MKKPLLSLLLLCTGITGVLAQPSLTQAYAFAPGEIYSSYAVDSVGILPGNGGAGQTWNFSTIQIQGSINSDTVELPSATPYASSFTTSTAALGENGGYNYFKVTSGASTLMGAATPNVTQAYSDPHIYFTYPFTYNSVVNDNVAATFLSGGMTCYRNGTSQTLADGYGTLILPNGTYNNVLRVHLYFTYVDSFAGIPTYGAYSYLNQYMWLDATHKEPIFAISYAGINSQWANNGAKAVSVAAWTVGVKENSINNSLKLFPNPTIGDPTVRFELKTSAVVSYTVLNFSGQKVKEGTYGSINAGTHSEKLDVSGLPPGIYLFILNADGVLCEKRIAVQ